MSGNAQAWLKENSHRIDVVICAVVNANLVSSESALKKKTFGMLLYKIKM